MREWQKTPAGKAHVAKMNARWRETPRGHANALKRSAAYRASEKGREADRRQRQRSTASGKDAARQAVKYAVMKGWLNREPCNVCGAERVHAHHPFGYDRENRLRVVWLCPKHHSAAHLIS